MRAIVTGGAGFIGSHLAEELISRGFSVTIWDNLFRGTIKNIVHILNEENRFVKLDMALAGSVPQMTELLLKDRPSIVFHYAAINGTQYFYDIPAQVLEANIAVTHNLMLALRAAKKQDSSFDCKVIYASSSEVYGEPFTLPTKESDVTYVNLEQNRDSYAASKLVGEFYVKLIAQELCLEYVILRIFNVYGPRMIGTKYGQVIPEFIKRLSQGEYPLSIYGDGRHMRSFCYITDHVSMSINLALSSTRNDVFNIGNTQEVSILELGSLVMQKMGKDPMFTFLQERPGDHKRRCPDTSKLFSIIGKCDFINLSCGIDRLLLGSNN